MKVQGLGMQWPFKLRTQTSAYHISLGFLLEEGSKLFEDQRLLERVHKPFHQWLRENTGMTFHHSRKLYTFSAFLHHFPRPCRPVQPCSTHALPITEMYKRLPGKYKAIWSFAS